MKLGTRNAGVRFERAHWGMPARLILYAVRDPYAGLGTIPWRYYRAFDLRPPVRLWLHWAPVRDASATWTGRDRRLALVEFEYGWGLNRRLHTLWP